MLSGNDTLQGAQLVLSHETLPGLEHRALAVIIPMRFPVLEESSPRIVLWPGPLKPGRRTTMCLVDAK